MRYKDIYTPNLIHRINRAFGNFVINSELDDVEQIPVEDFVKNIGWEVKYGKRYKTDFDKKVVTILEPDKYTPANRKANHVNNSYVLAKVFATELYIHENSVIEIDINEEHEARDLIIDALAKQLIAPHALVNFLAERIITALEVSIDNFTTNDIYTIAYRVSNILDVPTELFFNQLDIPGFISYVTHSVLSEDLESMY